MNINLVLTVVFFVAFITALHLFIKKVSPSASKKQWLLSGHYYIQWLLLIGGIATLGFAGILRWI